MTLSVTFIKNKKVFKSLKNKIRLNKRFNAPINNGFNGAYSGTKMYFIQKDKARIKLPRDKNKIKTRAATVQINNEITLLEAQSQ